MILEYCICNDKQDISIHLQIQRKQSHSSEGQTKDALPSTISLAYGWCSWDITACADTLNGQICPTGQQLLELHKTMHEPLATTLLS